MYRCRTLWLALLFLAISLPLWAAVGEDGRNPSDPLDQGGDNCTNATPISTIPYCDTGTTVNYFNDYPVPCLPGVASPDVVYRITPPVTSVLSFSLCGSAYNTAMTIWQGCPPSGELICCSDNVCGDDACCSGVTLLANVTYFVVVDGGAPPNNSGTYNFNVVQGQLCPTAPCAPCPYPNVDLEPNNVCTATGGTLACGDTVCGEVTTNNALDYYTFVIGGTQCQNVTIDVFGNDTPGQYPFGHGLNSYVLLSSFDCTVLHAQDLNSGVGEDPRIDSVCLPPGTYKILVSSDPQGASAGPYIVATSCTPCECPGSCPYPNQDVEPNNGCTSVTTTLACGDTVCGNVEPTGTGDYYNFRVLGNGCQLVTIDVFGDDTPGFYPFGHGLNPIVSLYWGACDSAVGFDDNSGVGEDARMQFCLPPGTYKIYIRGVPQGANAGPYILATACTPCECPNTCPYPNRDNEGVNNTCGTFNPPMICGDTLCGNLTAADQVDWYLITVVGPGSIRLKVDVFGNDTPGYYPFGLGLNPFFRVYGAGCTTFLGGDTDSGVGEDAHGEICLPQGSYNIGIASDDGSAGPYILATACEPCDTCPYPDFDVEPLNNQCGTNNEILHCGDAVCGEIVGAVAPDQDWYVLQLTQCTQLFIDVYGDDTPGWYPFGHGLNPAVQLYAADCSTLIAQDQNSGQGEDAQLNTVCLQPGIYMLRVYGELGTQGPYILFVGCETCQCDPPCEVICPPSALHENEPCPSFVDTVDGGCNTDPQHFLPLRCGDIYCATGYSDPNYTDRDWYRLIVTEPSQVRLCVSSEFNGYLNLYDRGPGVDGCEDQDLIDCIFVEACSGLNCISTCLPRGVYHVEYQATGLEPVNCWDYLLVAQCSPCEVVVCPAPDSLVISYPDELDAADPIADVTLRWPPVPGADEYRIYRTSDNNSGIVVSPANYIATTLDTFFVHSSVIANNGTNEIFIYQVVSYCRHHHDPCGVTPVAIEPRPAQPNKPRE